MTAAAATTAWSERVRTALHVLLVTARYPWPPRRGDQLRACQMLELLSPEHRVTLLTPRPAAGQPPDVVQPFNQQAQEMSWGSLKRSNAIPPVPLYCAATDAQNVAA